MKIIYCGLESSGKSLMLAKKIKELINRNKRYKKKYGFTRKIWSNLKFSDKFYNKNKEFIEYWKDINEIIGKEGIDVIHDEISADFSALKKEPLPRNINIWLRQGAKRGVHYYATAQEYHDVHLDFRRRTYECFTIKKIIGSRRGGINFPPIKWIWGLCFVYQLDINPYNELQPQYKSKIPRLVIIDRDICEIFDTYSQIEISEELPFTHKERICYKCGYKRVTHT